MDLVISIVVGVLVIEAYAWLPKISEWLIELAVRRLPVGHRERCQEEWKADSDALPNSGVKLVHALSLSCAVNQINAGILEAKFDEIDYLLKDLSDQHHRNVQDLNTLNLHSQHSQNQEKLQHLELQVTELVATAKQVASGMQLTKDLAKSCEALGISLIKAVKRLEDLQTVRIVRVNTMVGRADSLIKTAFQKRSHTAEQFRRRKLSSSLLALALDDLHDDLKKLKPIVELDGLDDEQRDREYEKILIAVESASSKLGQSRC